MQVHLLWTWGYTRAAIKLRAMINNESEETDQPDERPAAAADTEARSLSLRLRRSIDAGTSVGLSGVVMAAQQVPLAAHASRHPSSGPL